MRRFAAGVLLLAVAVGAVVAVDRASRRLVRQQLAGQLATAPAGAASGLANLSQRAAPLGDAGSLDELAAAAVSGDRRVASAAQDEVHRLLDSWRYATPRLPTDRLIANAQRLAAGLRVAGPGEHPDWSAATARQLLTVAKAAGTPASLELVEDCEAVLLAASKAPRSDSVSAADLAARSIPRPAPAPGQRAVAPPTARNRVDGAAEAIAFSKRPAPAGPSSPLPGDSSPAEPLPAEPPAAGEPAFAVINEGPPASDWRPDWSAPSPPPPSPQVASSLGEQRPPTEPTATTPETAPAAALDSLSDRELLARFLPVASRAARQPAALGPGGRRRPSDGDPADRSTDARLRQAVKDRGYGGVSVRDVRLLLSERASDRRTLAGRLLTS
ncbi:MAG: hypothetical protein AAF596_02060, partial [Planctomycetota bacterium]